MGHGRALHILNPMNLLNQLEPSLIRNGGLLLGGELLKGPGVLSQVHFGANQEDGSVGAVVGDFWVPLGKDVVIGGRVDY
uniref:Uncharacterized protein n=1 Tax=Arcella intermedia TaxID=1963864 RepID=A0A6B2LSZ2_9EUKA